MNIVRENNKIKFSMPEDIFEINEIQNFIDFINNITDGKIYSNCLLFYYFL